MLFNALQILSSSSVSYGAVEVSAARMGSYGAGALQCQIRGYTDTQGAAPWSLSGTRGSWVVFDLVPCMMVYMQKYMLSGCCSMLSIL